MNRQPAGTPGGGQFAPTTRTEPALELPAVAMHADAVRTMHETKLDRAAHLLTRAWESNTGAAAHDAGYAAAEADIALRAAMPQIAADADTTDLALQLVRMRTAQPGFTAPTAPLSNEQVSALARYALARAAASHHGAQALFRGYLEQAMADPSAPDSGEVPAAFDHAKGATESYAQSYAELTLGDVHHDQAPGVAERLVTALARDVDDVDQLQEHAWDPMYPPIPGVDD